MKPDSVRGPAAACAAALLASTALVTLLVWPLPLHLTTQFPTSTGTFGNEYIDRPQIVATLAWQSEALVSAPSALFDLPAFHPTPRAVLYGPTGLAALPLFAPVYLATGNPTLATNLLLVLSWVLTGATLYWVTWRAAGSHAAGLVAAATALTVPWVLRGWVTTAPIYAPLFWFPLVLHFAAQPGFAWRRTAGLAVVTALECLVDVVYVAPAVLAPLLVLGVARLVRRRERAGAVAPLVAVGAGVLAAAPLLQAHAALARADPGLLARTPWTLVGLQATVLPDHVLFDGPAAVAPVAWLLASVALLLATRYPRQVGSPARRLAAVASLFVAFGVALSLGPRLRVGNATVANYPLVMLRTVLPQLAAVRVPQRLAVAALTGTSILAGLGVAMAGQLAAGIGGRYRAMVAPALAGVALVLLLAGDDHLARTPLAEATVPAPALLAALATRNDPVVEIPLTVSGNLNPQRNAEAMYRAIWHRRPILNGYRGYWPADFPRRAQLAEAMPAREAIAALRAETGVGTVIVSRRAAPAVQTAWITATLSPCLGVRLVYEDRWMRVFDLNAPPDSCR